MTSLQIFLTFLLIFFKDDDEEVEPVIWQPKQGVSMDTRKEKKRKKEKKKEDEEVSNSSDYSTFAIILLIK